MTEIFEAVSAEDYQEFAKLVRQYAAWLNQRLAADAWFINAVLKHQSLDHELANLSTTYGPPGGKVLLAKCDGQIAGGVAYRELSDGICEMKRMFLRDVFRGRGLGRKLCDAIIAEAVRDGYSLMRLDTARRLAEAIALYGTFGFKECPPYRAYADELIPHLLFMEKELFFPPLPGKVPRRGG